MCAGNWVRVCKLSDPGDLYGGYETAGVAACGLRGMLRRVPVSSSPQFLWARDLTIVSRGRHIGVLPVRAVDRGAPQTGGTPGTPEGRQRGR